MRALTAASAVAVAPILLASSCSNTAPEPDANATSESSQFGPITEVPGEFVGQWELTGQECEPDSENSPDSDPAKVTLSIRSDFSYFMTIEGWPVAGTFVVERYRNDDLRLQLAGSMLEFSHVEGRLENWSEGEAVYPCGNIFSRTSD